MKMKSLPYFFSCLALLILTGCATTITRDPDKSVISRGIDQKEWNDAAVTMIESLKNDFINAGKLQSPPDKPALLAISRIVNNTGERIDLDLLVKKIQIALNRTDRIVTSTTIGIGEAVDPIAQEEQRRARLLGLDPSRPNYTLSGKVIEQVSRSGNIKDVSYTFQLSLTKTPEGFAVWEEEQTITKQIKRHGVGL